MRHTLNQSKRVFKICEFERQLTCYALAAATAGVGALASQECDAEIVYTKAHRQLTANTTLKLDLNHDGIADFSLKDTFFHTFATSTGRLSISPIGQENRIWGHTVSHRGYASALFAGVRVGPQGQFLPATGMMAATVFAGGARPDGVGYCTGAWGNVMDRYLGLKFLIAGKVHFGWARLNVSCPWDTFNVIGLLTGYAYETVPNRPIVTGKEKGTEDISGSSEQGGKFSGSVRLQPASLGRLAQGAAGLAARKGKQRKSKGL